jgi:hypothetical protein
MYTLTAQDIDNLSIGDAFPNCFNKLRPITTIHHKGTDANGKKFACFYQQYSADSTMSQSAKEGNTITVQPIPAPVLNEMRDWLKECEFREGYESHDMIDQATDAEIIKAIDRNYQGGVSEFIRCYYL